MAYPRKTIPVQDAVGMVLCHDITQIIPGQSKGPVFRKGHVVQQEDIPLLLQAGKEHLYVFEQEDGLLHENDAALRIASAVSGEHLTRSEPKEGRILLRAACHGLLAVDVPVLQQINALGEIALATLHSMQEVKPGQTIGGTRVIPLLVAEQKILQMEALASKPVVDVLPFRAFRVGMVVTGSEVYHGRIQDGFGPVVREKFTRLGSQIMGLTLTSDDVDMTSAAIKDFVEQGADMVVVTGGMSVDPDDRTPASIRAAGGRTVIYGAPVFPGSMFMMAYIGNVPVLGLPGCVMYHKASIFDLIVPRLLAGVDVTPDHIAQLGHGGFCAECPECRYPVCPFGKA